MSAPSQDPNEAHDGASWKGVVCNKACRLAGMLHFSPMTPEADALLAVREALMHAGYDYRVVESQAPNTALRPEKRGAVPPGFSPKADAAMPNPPEPQPTLQGMVETAQRDLTQAIIAEEDQRALDSCRPPCRVEHRYLDKGVFRALDPTPDQADFVTAVRIAYDGNICEEHRFKSAKWARMTQVAFAGEVRRDTNGLDCVCLAVTDHPNGRVVEYERADGLSGVILIEQGWLQYPLVDFRPDDAEARNRVRLKAQGACVRPAKPLANELEAFHDAAVARVQVKASSQPDPTMGQLPKLEPEDKAPLKVQRYEILGWEGEGDRPLKAIVGSLRITAQSACFRGWEWEVGHGKMRRIRLGPPLAAQNAVGFDQTSTFDADGMDNVEFVRPKWVWLEL